MRVAIVLTSPRYVYSGGRYCAFMYAEALAAAGHEPYVICDEQPLFLQDLRLIPRHDAVRFHRTADFRRDMPAGAFDVVILVPGTSRPGFYVDVELFARKRGARLVLLNFESPNWYNRLAPTPRPAREWNAWRRAARYASAILSISAEGSRWAPDFYQPALPGALFVHAYPPINTAAAEQATAGPRERRLLLFMRFTAARHKGTDDLDRLLCEAMRGYTLVIVLGKEDVTPRKFQAMVRTAEKFGVRIELRHKISDVEKFAEIKRAQLVLFPSLFEGFGYPPVESLYCNTPCVAFDLPVLRETCRDHLIYAKHGDWDDFRAKVSRALAEGVREIETRHVVEPLVQPEAVGLQLESAFRRMAVETPPAALRDSRTRVLELRAASGLSDPAIRCRNAVRGLRRSGFLAIKAAGKRLHRLRRRRARIVYYPPFGAVDALSSHYHRARWYLPPIAGKCERIDFYHTLPDPNAAPEPPPSHFDVSGCPGEHIRVRSAGLLRNLRAILSADLVIFWDQPHAALAKTLERTLGIGTAYVATDDPASMEFGQYCSLLWEHLTLPEERRATLDENRSRFLRVHRQLIQTGPAAACVFGTGPSLDAAYNFDFSSTVSIVCNSIVQNDRLLDHIDPKFICAGDVVSHFGVSAYAAKFRNQLVRALEQRNLYLVTTAKYGALFLAHHPALRERVFLLEQAVDEPVYDLTTAFMAPRLASTMNIHMLPLAATFSSQVFFLGCDGKNPTGGNEDFWAHSRDAQYHDLVESGHRSHPTFALLREMDTYERYVLSLAETIDGGERRGIEYRSLSPSFIAVLNERLVTRVNDDASHAEPEQRLAAMARRPRAPATDIRR